ncbi:hypothetical protein EFL95_17580 [Nocardioides marmorisolisilvae]|uniref:Uncharacterized protein n=1 Tax=Nocardioides marmorisolisilvae TaxID=1542737 RepID=A0A3N0DNN9_9ACTN|nr:hypothetical protein EFL95_17580 [Nocardioides marmorisolisilvae]
MSGRTEQRSQGRVRDEGLGSRRRCRLCFCLDDRFRDFDRLNQQVGLRLNHRGRLGGFDRLNRHVGLGLDQRGRLRGFDRLNQHIGLGLNHRGRFGGFDKLNRQVGLGLREPLFDDRRRRRDERRGRRGFDKLNQRIRLRLTQRIRRGLRSALLDDGRPRRHAEERSQGRVELSRVGLALQGLLARRSVRVSRAAQPASAWCLEHVVRPPFHLRRLRLATHHLAETNSHGSDVRVNVLVPRAALLLLGGRLVVRLGGCGAVEGHDGPLRTLRARKPSGR